MKKHTFYTECAYLAGLLLIAAGVAFTERADFGVSMVVAPAYVLYRRLSELLPFFTFGMAEYCLQAVLLLLLFCIVRRVRAGSLLSFATAVLYGFVLDFFMLLTAALPADGFVLRAVWYTVGTLLCSAGVSMMFHTYLPPEVYELFVKEISAHFRLNINRCKTVYDCVSCLVGLLLGFVCFGFGTFVGVKWGTVLCALVNGFLIGRFSALFEKLWFFRDALPWRSFFEGTDSPKNGKEFR